MNKINKFMALSFAFLALSSLLALSTAPISVQAIQKPSTPQFTIKLIDNSYDVPPTTTTIVNQYTGEKTTTTEPGYHVDLREIVITIKNQPFTSYTDEKGQKYRLYYYIEVKGHFGDEWRGFNGNRFQSDSGYSVIMCGRTQYNYHYFEPLPAAGSQLDFRVEAVIGYDGFSENVLENRYVYEIGDGVDKPHIFVDVVSSGWSKVQTFTIPEHGEASPPTQNTTPHSPTTTTNNNKP